MPLVSTVWCVNPATDRAITILHALTGSIDVQGGNVRYAQVPGPVVRP
jgi:hypothetical protein